MIFLPNQSPFVLSFLLLRCEFGWTLLPRPRKSTSSGLLPAAAVAAVVKGACPI